MAIIWGGRLCWNSVSRECLPLEISEVVVVVVSGSVSTGGVGNPSSKASF